MAPSSKCTAHSSQHPDLSPSLSYLFILTDTQLLHSPTEHPVNFESLLLSIVRGNNASICKSTSKCLINKVYTNKIKLSCPVTKIDNNEDFGFLLVVYFQLFPKKQEQPQTPPNTREIRIPEGKNFSGIPSTLKWKSDQGVSHQPTGFLVTVSDF